MNNLFGEAFIRHKAVAKVGHVIFQVLRGHDQLWPETGVSLGQLRLQVDTEVIVRGLYLRKS